MSEADPARMMRFVLDMREAGVTDFATLAALERTDRAHFAPEHLKALALDDVALPLAEGQSMTKPSVIGRMIAALDLKEGHNVLEVGAGSGFQAAAIAKIARRVTSLDRRRALVIEARSRVGALRIMNVLVHVGDGLAGWAENAPYDRIVLNGGVGAAPEALMAQLAEGGALLAAVGEEGAQRLCLHRKDGETRDLGAIVFPALEVGVAQEP